MAEVKAELTSRQGARAEQLHAKVELRTTPSLPTQSAVILSRVRPNLSAAKPYSPVDPPQLLNSALSQRLRLLRSAENFSSRNPDTCVPDSTSKLVGGAANELEWPWREIQLRPWCKITKLQGPRGQLVAWNLSGPPSFLPIRSAYLLAASNCNKPVSRLRDGDRGITGLAKTVVESTSR